MKEPAYVANVVSKYRMALDNKITEEDKENLNKTFNRTFTKGYLFHEDQKDITNILRPNNFGYEIGRISKIVNGMYEITLTRTLNQNDIIRISHNNEDVNLTVVKLYDKDGNLINKADDVLAISKSKKSCPRVIWYISRRIISITKSWNHHWKKNLSVLTWISECMLIRIQSLP